MYSPPTAHIGALKSTLPNHLKASSSLSPVRDEPLTPNVGTMAIPSPIGTM